MIRLSDASRSETLSSGSGSTMDRKERSICPNELEGPVFEPLQDPEAFARFRVDPDVQTLVWPNGADLAPEFLHEQARVPA